MDYFQRRLFLIRLTGPEGPVSGEKIKIILGRKFVRAKVP
jgi:hypothetical protein